MNGIQKTVFDGLMNMADRVKNGTYGDDDDFDAEAFLNDLGERVYDVIE